MSVGVLCGTVQDEALPSTSALAESSTTNSLRRFRNRSLLGLGFGIGLVVLAIVLGVLVNGASDRTPALWGIGIVFIIMGYSGWRQARRQEKCLRSSAWRVFRCEDFDMKTATGRRVLTLTDDDGQGIQRVRLRMTTGFRFSRAGIGKARHVRLATQSGFAVVNPVGTDVLLSGDLIDLDELTTTSQPPEGIAGAQMSSTATPSRAGATEEQTWLLYRRRRIFRLAIYLAAGIALLGFGFGFDRTQAVLYAAWLAIVLVIVAFFVVRARRQGTTIAEAGTEEVEVNGVSVARRVTTARVAQAGLRRQGLAFRLFVRSDPLGTLAISRELLRWSPGDEALARGSKPFEIKRAEISTVSLLQSRLAAGMAVRTSNDELALMVMARFTMPRVGNALDTFHYPLSVLYQPGGTT